MTVAPELQAAADKLREVKLQVTEQAVRMLSALEHAQSCGADVRDLDLQTIRVRFMHQIPDGMERKAATLVPKDAA